MKEGDKHYKQFVKISTTYGLLEKYELDKESVKYPYNELYRSIGTFITNEIIRNELKGGSGLINPTANVIYTLLHTLTKLIEDSKLPKKVLALGYIKQLQANITKDL